MMELRRFIEEKWVRDGKICHFWTEPAIRYRYQKGVVPVPIRQRQSGTGTTPFNRKGLVPVPIKVVSVPMLPTALIFIPLHC